MRCGRGLAAGQRRKDCLLRRRPCGYPAGGAARLARSPSGGAGAQCRWLLRWAEALDPAGHECRRERVEALLLLGQTEEALAVADAALAAGTPAASAPRVTIRRHREWLSVRERCLRRLGRPEEAERILEELLRAPPRDPALEPRCIDLSAHYNASLYDARGWHSDASLRELPETFSPGGVPFDIRGLIQLNSGVFPPSSGVESGKDLTQIYPGKSFPERVEGIAIGREAKALHFLYSSIWGRAAAGVEVGRLVIHREDGSAEDVPLRFGEDVIDWFLSQNQALAPERVAWIGGRTLRTLQRKTWVNPSPGTRIERIDFIGGLGSAAPFLVAVTAE
jgi:hypothetical protein